MHALSRPLVTVIAIWPVLDLNTTESRLERGSPVHPPGTAGWLGSGPALGQQGGAPGLASTPVDPE